MSTTPGSAVAAFVRRTTVAAFVDGVCRAAFVLGLVAAVVFLALRLAGNRIGPELWWLGALVPVLAFAAWRARAVQIAPALAASHLDQRLHLDGLLLSGWENGDLPRDWQTKLAAGMGEWRAQLPVFAWRASAGQPALALALAAALCWWPEPPAPVPPSPGAFAAGVAGVEKLLAEAAAAGLLPPQVGAEIADKLAGLRNARPDDPSAWRELDAFAGRIAREQLLASLERGTPGGNGSDQSAAVKDAVAALRALAADQRVPTLARGLFESALRLVGDDVDSLLQDPERLRAIAGSVAQMAQRLSGAMAAFGVTPGDVHLFERAAAALQQGGRGEPGKGGGGIARGPGAAALRFSAPAPGETAVDFTLPPGQVGPADWVPVSDSIAEPEVGPTAGVKAGGEVGAARGGASWQLQLAPRHRAVVQRFFGTESKDKR